MQKKVIIECNRLGCLAESGGYHWCWSDSPTLEKDYWKDGFCSDYCANKVSLNKYCSVCGKRGNGDVKKVPNHNYRCGYSYICTSCAIKEEERKKEENDRKKKYEEELKAGEYNKLRCDWCGKIYVKKDSTALKQDKYCCKKCEDHK